MNQAIFFDNGNYIWGSILEENKKTYLVETTIPKKKFSHESLVIFVPETIKLNQLATSEIDVAMLWELIEDDTTYSYQELSKIYFANDELLSAITLLIAISNPLIYFSSTQAGIFTKASVKLVFERQEQLRKQHEYQEKFNQIYNKLLNLECPDWQIEPLAFINKPDKNSLEFKAFNKAAKDLKLTIVELMFKLGYIKSIEDYLTTSFCKQYFPKGTNFDQEVTISLDQAIEVNNKVKIFSIDDNNTTEIDDAFSLQVTDSGYKIGIHISAPALNKPLLNIAAERLSTVYYPGNKITMLPEKIIKYYSLDEGKQLPVVSIYFNVNNDFNIIDYYSCLEQVKITENLRTENLEKLFNTESLELNQSYPFETELKLLYKFALTLEEKRGRPSVNQLMVDYNFHFEGEKIHIKPRLRGNPIDKLVSELMILANCSWGRMLTNAFIPAIYRVKQPNFPVTMTLTPNSHTGLNVDYYTWASSPLRRAVDLINQSQIINLITNDKNYLSATEYNMANVVENFDETYSNYLKFQDKLERYWSLKYLQQENIDKIEAVFTYRSNVQLTGVPITIDVGNLIKAKPQGSIINLYINKINLINQTFEFKIINP